MILIVTSKRDGHVEPVSRHFASAGIPWARINIEDFPRNVDIELAPALGEGRLWIKDSGLEVRLSEITAVWYRKPEPIDLRHFEMDLVALEYVEAEFTEIVLGIYALLGHAFWINNPYNTRIAHRKLLQLRTATEVGFSVPRSIVTNRPQAALGFASEIGGDLAIKSLGAISVIQEEAGIARQFGVFTRRVTPAEIKEHNDKVGYMPTLFQEFVEKESELRVTCVGKAVFACEIQTREGDITNDDYRFDTPNLRHEAVDRPDLVDRMHAYMRSLGLNFACFDFLVSKTGDLTFLEANANGQWYWVEQRTGQPIGEAIATELIRHSRLAESNGRLTAAVPTRLAPA
jgi:glutathione synthase/RimK-type ligase-like ATP-grasp enzyme